MLVLLFFITMGRHPPAGCMQILHLPLENCTCCIRCQDSCLLAHNESVLPGCQPGIITAFSRYCSMLLKLRHPAKKRMTIFSAHQRSHIRDMQRDTSQPFSVIFQTAYHMSNIHIHTSAYVQPPYIQFFEYNRRQTDICQCLILRAPVAMMTIGN